MMTIKDVMDHKSASDKPKKYWLGSVGTKDDFGDTITNEFYDGKTRMGPWATMSPKSWRANGVGKTGIGFAQHYKKQADGRWLKLD